MTFAFCAKWSDDCLATHREFEDAGRVCVMDGGCDCGRLENGRRAFEGSFCDVGWMKRGGDVGGGGRIVLTEDTDDENRAL